jgi:hypothetical protein
LSGFTQADGSFVVSFERRNNGQMPYRPRPVFVLSQNIRELEMFKALQKYLNVGIIQTNRDEVNLVVKSLDDINNVIIPHFDLYPPKAGKLKSYLIFKEVVNQMINKNHNTLEGLLQILDLAYFTHDTTLRTEETKQIIMNVLIDKFKILPKYEPLLINTNNKQLPINIEFITGLIDGDGSFNFAFSNIRRRVVPNFTVVQSLSDQAVLTELKDFFNCGEIYSLRSKVQRFQIENAEILNTKILPLLKEVHFNTVKQVYFPNCIKA